MKYARSSIALLLSSAAGLAWAGSLLLGCGSNAPEIPAELLEPAGDCSCSEYPEGPTGTEPGDLLANAEFEGWRDPRVADVTTPTESLGFGDFYDPDGRRGYRVLLLNATAAWCAACREEHETLPELYDTYREQGLVVLSLLFQDVNGDPPTVQLLANWTDAFDTNFPMGLDPGFVMGRYGPADAAPLNVIVETRTMTIRHKVVGNQAEVIDSLISAELEQSASP